LEAMLLAEPDPTFDISSNNNIARMRQKVEAGSRVHEESMLFECVGDQRSCIMGSDCESISVLGELRNQGLYDGENFVLREYLKNSDLERYKTTGSFPATQGPCLMCIRAEIAKALFHVRALERAFCPDTLLQDICNVVNVSTEYCLRDCIMSKPNR